MRSSVQRVAIAPQLGRFVKRRAGPPRQAAGRGCFLAFWQWGQAGQCLGSRPFPVAERRWQIRGHPTLAQSVEIRFILPLHGDEAAQQVGEGAVIGEDGLKICSNRAVPAVLKVQTCRAIMTIPSRRKTNRCSRFCPFGLTDAVKMRL